MEGTKKITLWMDPNVPLSDDPILEIHHPITSKLGGHGDWLEIERDYKINSMRQNCNNYKLFKYFYARIEELSCCVKYL